MATEVRAAHILVDDQAKAYELLARIKSGESFEAIAKQYSKCPSKGKGGDLGYFGKGQMVKRFEDAAFRGKKGEVVGPVKTEFGYHLIKIIDTR
ncbi:MAG TPA: peptidylprolyl isomerase [Methanomassiliicoccaceae archaeon]|jgi:peptidyl-prolyl cis-trans isomerase C|nr:peptidylprolyl isomerase [Euryarchaeota archaeon]HOB37529.1 peptidylprolyl isomerase [Methanomassiliicoccaceae archaeon]HPT74782.1 peptidylprolyl isomerase [Methanomassiliicoccaceae archaeon]HQA20985.1 peptidylprolyl isomerase [Methanomassiliicoccaceae archaeon]HQD87410.1 peptidylprolyl isomerase [Methanomassiliicoccaceae archaeon]